MTIPGASMKTISLVCLLLLAVMSHAELEAGLGLSAVSVPHYLGSDESEVYVLPVPYIRYQSETLNIDRDLVQQKLFQSGKWSIEISFSGAVPVDNEKSSAREGMDDLDFIGEMGPALQYHFSGDRLSGDALYLSMPVRGAISTDFTQADYRGYSFNPRLIWRKAYQYDDRLIRSQLSAGLRSASRHMHDYIYGVDAKFANAEREQYNGKAGYGGLTASYSVSILFDEYMLAGFLRYANISGASFDDSPLVRQNTSVLFGVAWVYVF
jgi:outer membrane scaffolding protein for murein synthesis (MipA/OmpV family)